MLIVFIIAFFTISPIVIMYTTGYRYDWQNGLLRETGSVSIDILPKITSVYLNGLKLKNTMPIRLKNITPQKYTLRLTATGYYDWQKEIEVKNKQTTYIKEIQLLKKNKPELLVKGRIENVALSGDGQYLVYITQDKKSKVWLRDLRAQTVSLIMESPLNDDPEVRWAKNNNHFTLTPSSPPYDYVVVVPAENPDKKIDLVKINGEAVTKTEWRETSESELYYSTAASIKSFSPDTEQELFIVANRYIDWFMENGALWTLQLTTSTQKLKIVRDTLGFSSEVAEIETDNADLPTKIITALHGSILVGDNSTSNVTLVREDKKFSFNGDNATISKYNNWWLIWTPSELWTYSDGEDPHLLNRSAEKLKQVVPLDKSNTLALVREEKVTALFPYYLIEHDLIDERVNSAAANSDNRTLFYATETGLWKLDY